MILLHRTQHNPYRVCVFCRVDDCSGKHLKYFSDHYEQIMKNINLLMINKINTVDYVENNVIKSRYVEQKYLLNNVLTRLFRTKQYIRI